MLDEGVAARQSLGDGIDDDARLTGSRPYEVNAARRIREVEVARQRAGIGEAGEIREVDAGPRHDGVEAAGIHLLRQPFELDEILDCSLHVSVSVCSTILRNRWVRSFFG